MESREAKNNIILAGDIRKEMDEIQKIQTSIPYFLTLLSNTCADFRTIMCC